MVRIATKALSKAEREREVFRRFGMASGFLPGGSFESRPDSDSEPDILYTPDAGPPQAFELVELVDRSYSGSVARQRDTKEACVQYLQSLPEGKQAAFHQAFADAEIALGFKPGLSMQRRKNLLPEVFQILMNLPVGFQGDVPTNRKLTQNLQFLVVHRGRFIGPLFDAPSTVWMGDPSVPGIKSKMSKTYKPVGELNLLAYIDGNPMPPDDVCFSALDAYLESLDKECLFAHIFVFGCHSNVVHRTWHRDI